MQDTPLDRLISGSFLILAGLGIIIFHKAIKEHRDSWNERLNWSGMWTGKYSPGGLIFTYVVIILIGVVLVAAGIAQVTNALMS